MKISIVMPVKGTGRAPWLRQALYSILLQDYDDLELLVQDGAPDDPVTGDPIVVQLFGLLGSRVNHQVERDDGIMAASNAALRRSTGDVLYWMGDDELLCPGALVAVNQVFETERFGGPYWLYGKTISADITGKTLGIDGAPATFEEQLEHNRIGTPSVFWNRQMMNFSGLFDLRWRWSGDYDMWLRFWRIREPWFLDQTLGVFRHHEQQASNVQGKAIERDVKIISWRQRCLGNVISAASNRLQIKKAYDFKNLPESVN